MKSIARLAAMTALLGGGMAVGAQELDAHFSCSRDVRMGDERIVYADTGEMRIDGERIQAFRWESAVHRSTHGFDCSIDESDGLLAEVHAEPNRATWRVGLVDAEAARKRRGYDFDRRMNCTIRLQKEGDMLQVKPTCPALCGSRSNFTDLSVNLKTGECRYED